MKVLSEIENLPSALENFPSILNRKNDKQLVIFLDYDGTLTPIVSDPEQAVLTEEMRGMIKSLAEKYPVAVISGRDLLDLKGRVAIDDIFYAGSHGFDISGPNGLRKDVPAAKTLSDEFDKAEQALKTDIFKIRGAKVERKLFGVAVHYRNVAEVDQESLKDQVKRIAKNYKELKLTDGKKVIELRPNLAWNKGSAVQWLLSNSFKEFKSLVIYIGDDLTDEDAFRVLNHENEIGILVRDKESHWKTSADFSLNGTEEVKLFLKKILDSKPC